MQLHNADCFEIFPELKDHSVDLVFCDPPYGVTKCKWDSCLDFGRMWQEVNRVVRPRGAIVFTACQPFTTLLIGSNLKKFKCEWIWVKTTGSNFAQVKHKPFKEHESVLVFSGDGKGTAYYPIKEERKGSKRGKIVDRSNWKKQTYKDGSVYSDGLVCANKNRGTLRYPSSIQYFSTHKPADRGSHPTQKPVALCEYFIKTYSRPCEVVLDFAMGSGTTGVACVNTHREFVGIELDQKYFDLAKRRIETTPRPMFPV